jgi:hypothetical protein
MTGAASLVAVALTRRLPERKLEEPSAGPSTAREPLSRPRRPAT